MGGSFSNNKGHTKTLEEVTSNRQRFQNLIYENEGLSQRTSQTHREDSIATTIKHHHKNHQIQLNQAKPHNLSNKKMLKQESVISNFDKLSMKNSRIVELSQQLNEQLQTYSKEKKKKMSQKEHHHRTRPRRKRTHSQSVILGIWIGVTISIVIVLIVIIQINNLSIANESNFSRDFPTWRGIAIWIFYVWMLGFDVYIYDKFRIRFKEILNIKPNHHPQAINIFRIAGFHSSMFVILFLFYVLDVAQIYHIPGFAEEYFALISWALFALFLIMPLPIFSNKGRFFVWSLFIDSLLSPFRGVPFPVTWMTDQAVSMAVPLKDLQYTICYYTEMDFKSPQNVCQDSNRISTVLVVVVSVCSIRILQCIRQGYDKGEYFMTPFFFNTFKYLVTLLTAVFAFEYKLGADSVQAAWLLFAVISSVYSFSWDLKMDWDLLQRNDFHPLLREKLVYGSSKIYYLIIVGNFLMRMTWIITISPKLASFIGNSNLVFLITGMIEIFRRGVWNLLRVQKEHIILLSQPPKDLSINKKALQLERKLSTVQNSLTLQIKMFKFFQKLQKNHQHLKVELLSINDESIEDHDAAIQAYNKKFQEEEFREISNLIQEILKSDSFLKKKLQEDTNTNKVKNIPYHMFEDPIPNFIKIEDNQNLKIQNLAQQNREKQENQISQSKYETQEIVSKDQGPDFVLNNQDFQDQKMHSPPIVNNK